MGQHRSYPFEGDKGTAPSLSQFASGSLGINDFSLESASTGRRKAEVAYDGEEMARIPALERAGGWLVLVFTAAFASFLVLMDLSGQAPGQSFSLKSISDCLQFGGEAIGLVFCVAITLRLHKASVVTGQKLREMEARNEPSNSQLVTARTDAQNTRRSYWAWLLLSIAIALYASGQAVWTSYDVRMPSASVPFPGLYDIGFVASYPFFVIGALLLTRRNTRGVVVGRLRVLLDALLVIGAAFSLSWFFILSPSVASLTTQPSFGAAFLAIYFPGGDLLLVTLGAFLMFSQFSTRERQAVFARLCLGLFFLAVTDSILVWLSLSFSFNTGTIQDVLWPLSMQMVGLAAIAYPRSVALERESSDERSTGKAEASLTQNRLSALGVYFQTAAPFVIALGSSAILLTIVPSTNPSQRFVASMIALILFVLVTIRQTLTLNENNRLRLQLAGELVLSRRELQVTRREADSAIREAQEKQQLEQGVQALQAVHARIAHGDFSVRASTEPGPLQAVAVSFNLMIERLKDLVLRANRYEQLVGEIGALQEALEHLSQGVAAWPATTIPQSKTELRALYLSVERVQRFQSHQWRSLLNVLERTVAPLGRIQMVLGALERQEQRAPLIPGAESGERGSAASVYQVEQQLLRLIEQIRDSVERLEGRSAIWDTPLPPQAGRQAGPLQGAPEDEKQGTASQLVPPASNLPPERRPKIRPGHFPQRPSLYPSQERGGERRF